MTRSDSGVALISLLVRGGQVSREQQQNWGISRARLTMLCSPTGHRRDSWTTHDIDELVELRARQRTFDGELVFSCFSQDVYGPLADAGGRD